MHRNSKSAQNTQFFVSGSLSSIKTNSSIDYKLFLICKYHSVQLQKLKAFYCCLILLDISERIERERERKRERKIERNILTLGTFRRCRRGRRAVLKFTKLFH